MKLVHKCPVLSSIVGYLVAGFLANVVMMNALKSQSLGLQLMSFMMLNVTLLAMIPNVGMFLHQHLTKISTLQKAPLIVENLRNVVLVMYGVVVVVATPFVDNNTQNEMLLSMLTIYPVLTYMSMMLYAEKLRKLDKQSNHRKEL